MQQQQQQQGGECPVPSATASATSAGAAPAGSPPSARAFCGSDGQDRSPTESDGEVRRAARCHLAACCGCPAVGCYA
jgi:hypothetical protein